MLAVLTGGGLAMASGLNAFIPLIAMGLIARFTGILSLPEQWQWLSGDWALIILAVLLLVDVVADKVPAVDHLNDVVQTAVRPAAGGITFAAGSTSRTDAVPDPDVFSSSLWIPIAIGVLTALVIHLFKSLLRAMINLTTGGLGAPVASVVEDMTAIAVAMIAVLLPVLVILCMAGVITAVVVTLRRRTRYRRRQLRV